MGAFYGNTFFCEMEKVLISSGFQNLYSHNRNLFFISFFCFLCLFFNFESSFFYFVLRIHNFLLFLAISYGTKEV